MRQRASHAMKERWAREQAIKIASTAWKITRWMGRWPETAYREKHDYQLVNWKCLKLNFNQFVAAKLVQVDYFAREIYFKSVKAVKGVPNGWSVKEISGGKGSSKCQNLEKVFFSFRTGEEEKWMWTSQTNGSWSYACPTSSKQKVHPSPAASLYPPTSSSIPMHSNSILSHDVYGPHTEFVVMWIWRTQLLAKKKLLLRCGKIFIVKNQKIRIKTALSNERMK